MIQLRERDYTFDELTGDEDVILDELKDKLVEGYGYVCDAISELAESNVPTYYNDTWSSAEDIEDYINQAIQEGLTDGCKTITEVINWGYYQRYSSLFYDNLEDVIFNAGVEILNDKIEEFSQDDLDKIEIDEWDLENRLDNELCRIDSGSNSSRISDAIDDIIEEIREEINDYKEEHCAECGNELDDCECCGNCLKYECECDEEDEEDEEE